MSKERTRRSHLCGSWGQSDRLDGVGWAAIFIWAALVVGADAVLQSRLVWWDGWGVFFVGTGLIILSEAAVRIVVEEYQPAWAWNLIVGSVSLAIGLSTWDGLQWVWAPALAVAALVILLHAFRRSSERPA